MMLAECLLVHNVGKDWRICYNNNNNNDNNNNENSFLPLPYFSIIKKFEDKERGKFSIHQIAKKGTQRNIKIGNWFAPSDVSLVLRDIVKEEGEEVEIYVPLEGVVYRDRAVEHLKSGKGLLVIIPRRLGVDNLSSCYFDLILKTFQFPESIGVIGGKPNSSYYFIGYLSSEESLIYFDPHRTSSAFDLQNLNRFSGELSTYQNTQLNLMKIRSMDPSMAFAFYFRHETEFDQFFSRVKNLEKEGEEGFVFSVAEKENEGGDLSCDWPEDVDDFDDFTM